MHIPILTGVPKGHITVEKIGSNLPKNVLLQLNFQGESHLDANCSFSILAIYRKWLLFQFLACCIHIHIPILTGVHKKGY